MKIWFVVLFFSTILDCDSVRRKNIVDDLNAQYEEVLQHRHSILATYTEVIEQNPYRVLGSYSYNFEENSLRSERIAPKSHSTTETDHSYTKVFYPSGFSLFFINALRNFSHFFKSAVRVFSST